MKVTLWNKDFVLLWIGHSQSGIGNALYIMSLSYLMLELTGSAKYTAFAIAASSIPYILSPIAGTVVDRFVMKPVLIISDFFRGCIMIIIYLLATLGSLTPWTLIILSFFLGVAGVIYRPAFAVSLPSLVPKKDIPRANALNALTSQVSSLIGFTSGGFLVGMMGTKLTILINALTFMLMAFLLCFIHFPIRKKRSNLTGSIWKEVIDGFHFVVSEKKILMIPVLFFIMSVSYIPIEILMPIKMKLLEMGPSGYGTFFACLFSGAILSSLLIAKFGNRFDLTNGTSIGLLLLSLPLLGIALLNSFSWICIMGFLFGLSNSFVSVNLVSYVQTYVNEDFRGRVFGVFGTIENLGMPVALSGIGFLVGCLPVHWIFLINASILFLITLVWFLLNSHFAIKTSYRE